MTWVGELSSIKLSMGQKLEKGTSDSASEVMKLDHVD